MKTFSQKSTDVARKWILIDASEGTLGRIATLAAQYLIGKHKPSYTPHVDGGDYVVVINANKVGITGNKLEDKKYYSYSGFPGGLKEKTLGDVMSSDATYAIIEAVKGMLPKNKLRDERLARLRVFAGAEHNHGAQQPVKIGVKNG